MISCVPWLECASLEHVKGGSDLRSKIERLKSRGQGLVEYALILVLVAIVVIVILSFLGQQVNNTFSRITSTLVP
jgi:pilus assembly protein Flp/PilA